MGYNKEAGLTQRSSVANTRSTTCFSIYQLFLQIKNMKIWQQVLAQQMKPLISPILNDFDSSAAPTFLGCLKLPVPPSVRRPQRITCAAVRVLQAG